MKDKNILIRVAPISTRSQFSSSGSSKSSLIVLISTTVLLLLICVTSVTPFVLESEEPTDLSSAIKANSHHQNSTNHNHNVTHHPHQNSSAPHEPHEQKPNKPNHPEHTTPVVSSTTSAPETSTAPVTSSSSVSEGVVDTDSSTSSSVNKKDYTINFGDTVFNQVLYEPSPAVPYPANVSQAQGIGQTGQQQSNYDYGHKEHSGNSSCQNPSHNHTHPDHHHEHTDKVHQLLWDIFGDDEEDNESDEELPSSNESVSRAGEHEDDEEDNLTEADDSIDASENQHVINKRSTDKRTSKKGSSSHSSHNRKRTPSNNKSKTKKGNRNTSSQRHTKRRVPSSTSKSKSKAKATKNNIGKYNEYMDVVLKRMNSMIKTKQMDPLMVNLFSGGGNNNNKKKEEPKDNSNKNKNKKKKNTSNKKKKGGKNNRARMESLEEDTDNEGAEVEEAEAKEETVQDDVKQEDEMAKEELEQEVESLLERLGTHDDEEEHDSSGSGTVELDNDHDGVFRRDVFVHGLDEGDDSSDEDDSGVEREIIDPVRNFRKMRALIVNGSMKRSNANVTSPAAVTEDTKKADESVRGFSSTDKEPQPDSSSEESERKKQSNKKTSSKKQTKNKNESKKKENNKNKKKSQKPTRGVLKGLSSLRRSGNVDVVRQGDKVRIVRSKFLLGPVTLEIVPRGTSGSSGSNKKKGRKPKAEDEKEEDEPEKEPAQPQKVTAVASQLKGIIEVRLKKNAATTIKRLRVFPPTSVKIKPSNKNGGQSSNPKSVPRYSKVTPVATHRLRQIASAVVRQGDVRKKGSGLSQAEKKGSGKGTRKKLQRN